MRPRAGYLPTLALGRPRGSSTSGIDRPRGRSTGVWRVTLLRGASRQVYRVYSEEDFLAGEDWLQGSERDSTDHARSGPIGGRLAGVAALSVAITAVTGVVVMYGVQSRAGSDRRSPGRRSPAPPVADRAARQSAVGGRPAKPAAIAASRAPAEVHARTEVVSRPAAAATDTDTATMPTTAPAITAPSTTGLATTESATVGPATTGHVTAKPTTTTGPVATGSTTTAHAATETATAGGAHPEFGFER